MAPGVDLEDKEALSSLLESIRHDEYRSWLAGALTGDETRQPFAVSELVLSSFLRLVTNHRVYRDPTPPPVALDFCQRVLAGPAARCRFGRVQATGACSWTPAGWSVPGPT